MSLATFRSRARVIDLLGRQQIADSPTAMGELFKNALDAGARNTWVDFWKDEELLVVRDDGLGMRTEDVLGKWLILATESKYAEHRKDSDDPKDKWPKYADSEQKTWLAEPSYGEKGIGRLSIASLGRLTVLWTVWGKGDEKQGTLALVHWNLFQHPTKLFEELPIPVLSLNRPAKSSDVQTLFDEFKKAEQFKALAKDQNWRRDLRNELVADLDLDVTEVFSNVNFSWDSGTTFCLLKIGDQVEEMFLKARQDIEPSADFPPDRLKSYHIFSTFWDPFHKHKNRAFHIHPRYLGEPIKRVHRYWEPGDFQECDHHIRIKISEDGFASGFVKNYGKGKQAYERQLKKLPAGHASPGEFLFEIGYVQGQKEHSPLPDDTFAEITKRLDHAGGFSIYLNNVRVQPYGGIDSDFAGFEERRLKNAGRYYFSKRRMFGGVFIPSKEQTNLREKAGREGFIVNGAQRGLRFWIEDLVVDLADTYFGRLAEREDKQKKKRQKESAAAKARLDKEKRDYLESIRIHRGWLRDFENRAKEQVQKLRGLLASESNAVPGTFLKDCEREFELLRKLALEIRDTPNDPPIGVVIEGDALDSVNGYITDRTTSITNLDKEIADRTKDLQSYALRSRSVEEQERKIASRISAVDARIRESIVDILAPAIKQAEHLGADLKRVAQDEIGKAIEFRNAKLDGITTKKISTDKSGELAKQLEGVLQDQINFFEGEILPKVKRLANDVAHLTDNTSGAIILTEQTEELTLLKERLSFLIEAAQLGLILEAANHEHEKQVDCIRESVKYLAKRVPEDAKNALHALSDSFEIIDTRMRLFDPLIRRQTATQTSIKGTEIEEFLKHRFPESFADGNLLQITESFRKGHWPQIKRPVFLGAIHNIFHNALYWCKKGHDKPQIRISAAGPALTISDSGPGVSKRDLKRIFEPGFSRRPNGRGLGLYIAREALRAIGYELFCPPVPDLGALSGANFTILQKTHVLSDE
jgi:signal transduction histidine kinase